MITIERYQLENLLSCDETVNFIFSLLDGKVKDYAKDFLKKEKEEKRKALNEKRKKLYHEKMEHYKKVFA